MIRGGLAQRNQWNEVLGSHWIGWGVFSLCDNGHSLVFSPHKKTMKGEEGEINHIYLSFRSDSSNTFKGTHFHSEAIVGLSLCCERVENKKKCMRISMEAT